MSALLPDGRVLVAGGTAGRSAVLYTPSTGVWTPAAPMLRSVGDGSATTLSDGRVLVVGGGSATTQLYDPSSDTWTAGPNLPAALHGTSAGLFPDGRVIVVGRAAAEQPAAVMYSPSGNRFTTLPSPTLPSQTGPEVGVMLPSGSFFTTFGSNGPSIYTPSTNRWTNLGPAPTYLPDKVAIALMPNGNVMLGGGSNWGFGFPTPVTRVLEVDPTTGEWKVDQNMPRDYSYASSYLFDGAELVSLGNGRILATGGIRATDEDHLYDPQSGSWSPTPGRNAHGGTLTELADGSVLVAGGYVDSVFPSQGTVTDQAYVFTP